METEVQGTATDKGHRGPVAERSRRILFWSLRTEHGDPETPWSQPRNTDGGRQAHRLRTSGVLTGGQGAHGQGMWGTETEDVGPTEDARHNENIEHIRNTD